MRYRIKTITYANGRKAYFPYFKKFLGWYALGSGGETYWGIHCECEKREKAIARIDIHFSGNTTKQTIEFEYINKK